MSAVLLEPWEQEQPPTGDERLWTPGVAEQGWAAWNKRSPEADFCRFAAALVALARPKLVIETGVGQGYITRRVLMALPKRSKLVAFESDDEWREGLLRTVPIWNDDPRVELSPDRMPSDAQMRRADVVILDSEPEVRELEMGLWFDKAKSGSLLLAHDVDPKRPDDTTPGRFARAVEGVGGVMLPNPRGGFLARKD